MALLDAGELILLGGLAPSSGADQVDALEALLLGGLAPTGVEPAPSGTHPPLTVTALSLSTLGRGGPASGIGLATRGRLVPLVIVEYVPPPRVVQGRGRARLPLGAGRVRQPVGGGRASRSSGSGKVY